MEENVTYTVDQLREFGLNNQRKLRENAEIYIKDDKVYFFEQLDSEHLRLYTVINKRSFFL
jgi:hypothetical protein